MALATGAFLTAAPVERLRLDGAVLLVGVPVSLNTGAEVKGREVPGAEVPGAKVPGVEVPGAEVPGVPEAEGVPEGTPPVTMDGVTVSIQG